MAARKTGTVKPPILDLEANRQRGKRDFGKMAKTLLAHNHTLPIIAGIIGGAILGVIMSLLLAMVGFWPGQIPEATIGNSAANIASLEKRSAELENSIAANASNIEALNELKAGLDAIEQRVSANAQTGKTTNETLALLRQQIEELQLKSISAEDVPALIDLSRIEKHLTALDEKIAAIDAGANSADASVLVNSIAILRQQSDILNSEITGLGDLAEQTGATLSALKDADAESVAAIVRLEEQITALEAAKSISATSPSLPISLIGFEAAINSGRGFETELIALNNAMPDIAQPQILLDNAKVGFAAPEEIARQFTEKVPAMLAEKPVNADASWQEKLTESALSLLAIRPTGNVGGDRVEAIIARIETALGKGDFIAANNAFAALPENMQKAAGGSRDQIGALATAQNFAASIKTAILNPTDNTDN